MLKFKLKFNFEKKNNSENVCNYEVEIVTSNSDKTVFKGPLRFSIKPKEAYFYELTFLPNAEEKYEVRKSQN